MTDPRAPLTESLEVLLRFGALMLRAGDTAFRVRDAMHRLAQALGIERLEVELSTVGLTATAWIGGEATTLTRETGPPGVDASKIAALEALSLGAAAGLDTATLGAELDRIEKAAPLHGLLPVALSMAVASTAFSYLNGGDLLATGAAAVSGGIGQAARTLLSRQGFNQFAMTALCAVLASGLYCLIVIGFGVRTFAFAHAIGFISSVLFLVPGFPLVAALLDLTQHQTKAGVTRLFYGVLLTLSAACGMSVVAMLAGLAPAPAAPPPGAIEPLTVLGRALACLAGGYGYGILFNNPHRTVLAVALLSMVGNEVRLGSRSCPATGDILRRAGGRTGRLAGARPPARAAHRADGAQHHHDDARPVRLSDDRVPEPGQVPGGGRGGRDLRLLGRRHGDGSRRFPLSHRTAVALRALTPGGIETLPLCGLRKGEESESPTPSRRRGGPSSMDRRPCRTRPRSRSRA